MTASSSSRRVVLAATLATLASLASALPAEAYCRKSTKSPEDASYDPSVTGSCGDEPGGLPLFWPIRCIEYRVIVEPELQGAITLDRARAITVSAAKAWTEAPCTRTKGGLNSPTIRLVDVDEARCNGGPLGTAAATKNEIRFRGSEPPKPGTLAVTTNVFVPASGLTNEASMAVYKSQIFDAYAKDPNGQEQTFAAVVRHEMGHFLGLAHSDQKTAIMYAYYQSSPAPGLTDDDLAAICDAYDPTAPVGDGCAVSSGATHDSGANLTPVVVVAAIALASFKGRAARRRALGLLRHRPKNP